LTSSIPDLKRNHLPRLGFHLLFDKIGSDSGLLANAGFFILIALNEARFSHAGVSNHYDLKKLFVFTIGGD
jgi:hypothetical protein